MWRLFLFCLFCIWKFLAQCLVSSRCSIREYGKNATNVRGSRAVAASREALLGCGRQTACVQGCGHKHGWSQNWGHVSTTNTWKKRCWVKGALEMSQLWHIPALWEGGKDVRKKVKARTLCPSPFCPVNSWAELFWEEREGDPESQGGWRRSEGRGLLHFWHRTQWQKWPKLFYKELFWHLPSGPLVFGEGVQVKIMSAICTQLSQGAWGLCNICYCWWKFDLQSSGSNPGLWGPGCFSYLNSPEGTYMFTLVRLCRLTKMSGVFFL